MPPHAYVLMTIYFLQKLNPPILPVLHELINSKKVNTRDEKSSLSQCLMNQINENKNGIINDSESNEDSDDDEKVIFL